MIHEYTILNRNQSIDNHSARRNDSLIRVHKIEAVGYNILPFQNGKIQMNFTDELSGVILLLNQCLPKGSTKVK